MSFSRTFHIESVFLTESMENASNKTIWIVLPILLFLLFSCMKDAAFYVSRGNDYANKGQYEEAISAYNKALEINPRYALAYHNRGSVYAKKNQYNEAISDFTKALEINPKFAAAYYYRGITYFNKGQYEEAISDFTKALEINPRDALTYYNRGIAYDDKGQYDEAISDYTKALEIDPKDGWAYYNRGIVYGKKGQYDQAISDYYKALEINPICVEAYNNLAWVLATARESKYRNGKKAVELALKACELSDWKNQYCLGTLAAAYARIGDFDKAVEWQKKALESYVGLEDEKTKTKLRTEGWQRLNLYLEHKPYAD
jgi:tetratricopeptide (TPR) repeat protein